jgi:hypothetical protein
LSRERKGRRRKDEGGEEGREEGREKGGEVGGKIREAEGERGRKRG